MCYDENRFFFSRFSYEGWLWRVVLKSVYGCVFHHQVMEGNVCECVCVYENISFSWTLHFILCIVATLIVFYYTYTARIVYKNPYVIVIAHLFHKNIVGVCFFSFFIVSVVIYFTIFSVSVVVFFCVTC